MFKAYEPSEAMLQALQKRMGQGGGGSKGSDDTPASSTSAKGSVITTSLHDTSSLLKNTTSAAPMLGVPSQDSGWNRIDKSESRGVSGQVCEGGSQMQCTVSDGRNSMTALGGVSNYKSSGFAPQFSKSSSGFDIDALSGSGPSMSSTAGPNFGADACSPKLKCAGQVGGQEKMGGMRPLSQSVTSLPNGGSSLPPRPNSAKFGMVKASSALYPRPREEDPGAKKDLASAEPQPQSEPSAVFPSTPSRGDSFSSQNWQPNSQPGQGCSHDQSDQPAEAPEGELVYLGAGLYGKHTEHKVAPAGPKKPQKKERVKVLPGRVAPLPPKVVSRPPPRPTGPGPLQGAAEQILQGLPPRSMKLEATDRIAASMREQRERAASAKRARSQDSFAVGFGSSAPGRMGQGNSAPPSSRLAPGAPVPLPNACEDREKKRLENREARRQSRQSVETPDCQTGRLSQDCYTGRLSHTSSAPSLRGYAKPVPSVEMEITGPTAEDIEKQKMRLACKMEILGFYDGYRSALGKMTKDQNKKLASKLTSADKEVVTDTVKQLNKDRQTQLDEWSQKTENQKSVHRRLRLINEFYSDTFDGQCG